MMVLAYCVLQVTLCGGNYISVISVKSLPASIYSKEVPGSASCGE